MGAVFSAMKPNYVVVPEQAHPIGPAYSFPKLKGEVTQVIIVACLVIYALSCCTYTALVSLLFGTVIPTSFNINGNVFIHLFH